MMDQNYLSSDRTNCHSLTVLIVVNCYAYSMSVIKYLKPEINHESMFHILCLETTISHARPNAALLQGTLSKTKIEPL